MKTGVFKKLVALAAVVAMVCSFAVCASAVSVTTTTQYVPESNNLKVSVTANVSGIEGATEQNPIQVTYYATNPAAAATNGVVYVDQKPTTNGSVSFPFVTNAAYLKSAAKVGYTSGTATADNITGYTLTCKDYTIDVPTAGGAISIPYTPADGRTVKEVSVEGATKVSDNYANNNLTLVLSNVTGDVTVNVTEEDLIVLNPEGEYMTGGLVIADGRNDKDEDNNELVENAKAAAGDRKLTVVGTVVDLKPGAEYGIIVSTSAIEEETVAELPAGAYKALGKGTNGVFAVQIIDTSAAEDTTFLVPETDYYTAIYYQVDDEYFIVPGDTLNTSDVIDLD